MREEIYIESFGYRVRAKGGLFHIIVPDPKNLGGKEIEVEYAPHQVETLLLNPKGGTISTSAIELALRNDVDIFITDHFGNIQGRFLPTDPQASMRVMKAQFQLVGKPASLDFVKKWLDEKFRRKMNFVQRVAKRRTGEIATQLQETHSALEKYRRQLSRVRTDPVEEAAKTIRGIEGTGAKIYFEILGKVLPPAYAFEGRSRQPAQDLFNCSLNYGYAILYRKVENHLIKAGIHPYGGFLHSMGREAKAMVFDFIEPYRPLMDEVIYLLCNGKKLTHSHADTHEGGGFLLNKSGKELVAKMVHAVFQKTPEPFEGKKLTLHQIMRTEAREFAASLEEK